MLISPGAVPQGIVNNDLLSHYEVLPTLLEYLGLPNPQAQTLPGRSFAPLFRGDSLSGHEHVIVFDEYGPVRMIRSRDLEVHPPLSLRPTRVLRSDVRSR